MISKDITRLERVYCRTLKVSILKNSHSTEQKGINMVTISSFWKYRTIE